MSHVSKLRSQYPVFRYVRYFWEVTDEGLVVSYFYHIPSDTSDDIEFCHRLVFHQTTTEHICAVDQATFESYLFSIGIAEMFSYWKTTCSPTIHLEAGVLNEAQLKFWHTLLIHGMGEYFFVNDIDFTAKNFVTFENEHNPLPTTETTLSWSTITARTHSNTTLIPIGGGKDSAVTARLLSDAIPDKIGAFTVNTDPAAAATIDALELKKHHTITRSIDATLLQMNNDGFLNGHVPFSSILAFLSTFIALLHGYRYVALSNEQSSNEGNVVFHGTEINHQYSKSFAFEHNFRQYVRDSFDPEMPEYFSFLRPLHEVQIAQLLAQHALDLLPVIRSCNRGARSNTWCNNCAKCLFSYSILYPFVPKQQLAAAFGADLYQNTSLLPLALELIGETKHKPLDCVGTHAESQAAFATALQQSPDKPLLKLLRSHIDATSAESLTTLLSEWSEDTALPEMFEHILRTARNTTRTQ